MLAASVSPCYVAMYKFVYKLFKITDLNRNRKERLLVTNVSVRD